MRTLDKKADTLATGQITVTTTATQIVSANTDRRALLIVNHGTTDVYIGTSSVATSDGVLLKGTAGANITVPGTMAVFGIVSSGTQAVSFIEIRIAGL